MSSSFRMSSAPKAVKRKYPGDNSNNQEEEFEVEAILDKKTISDKEHFQVKWVGWPMPTWELAENCTDCKDAIKAFESRLRGKSPLPGNSAGKASTSRFKVQRGATVAQLVGLHARDNADGTREVFMKVEYDDKTTEIVPSDVLLKECPMTLIKYYESLMKFE